MERASGSLAGSEVQALVGGHLPDPCPERLDLRLAPCDGGRDQAATGAHLVVPVEQGNQRAFSQFARDHRRPPDGDPHALQGSTRDSVGQTSGATQRCLNPGFSERIGNSRRTAPPARTFGPQGPTLGELSDAYLQDYQVRQFRSQSTARGRIAHLTACFGRAARAAALTTYQIRQYQLARRAAGAATGTINRETSALHRMCTLAVHWGWLDTVPGFPDRLRENPPRQGFFEHPEYLAVRAHLPAPWQDILDLAYYSGWRKNEILGLTWDELDEAGGVIRLSPARSKTLVGRILPISQPIAEALARRRARRDPDSPLVFHRDGIPIRRWRTAWRTACQAAGVPTRFLHDCRRTAARNLIRASVPERVAMLLTGHKTRAIFDRYNIINEQELLEAGDQLVEYLAQHAQATPRGGRPHPACTAVPRTAPPLRLVRRTTA